MPFWLAVSLLEEAEWLVSLGRSGQARPLLDEAKAIFVSLRALPWLQRLERLATADSVRFNAISFGAAQCVALHHIVRKPQALQAEALSVALEKAQGEHLVLADG